MSKKHSLLLVEDDKLLGPLYLHLLSDAGYAVTHCQTAAHTEETLLKQRFDLILLDVMLPDLSGLELLRRFHRLISVPIVLLTNLDQPRVKETALQFGALGCLIKSEYTPDIFLDKISSYLASASDFR
jgi:DNA-binding response OmpR family regulator